jgi:hypothetical protein
VGADQYKPIPTEVYKPERTMGRNLGHGAGSQIHGAAQRTKGRLLWGIQSEHRLKQATLQILAAIEYSIGAISRIEPILIAGIEMDGAVPE